MDQSRDHERDRASLDGAVIKILIGLQPRLRICFPELRDDAVLGRVMKRAGRRLASRISRDGTVRAREHIAWAILRRLAATERRQAISLKKSASERNRPLPPTPGDGLIARSGYASPHQILQRLSQLEQRALVWKQAGFSNFEIAGYYACEEAVIERLFKRARRKLRWF